MRSLVALGLVLGLVLSGCDGGEGSTGGGGQGAAGGGGAGAQGGGGAAGGAGGAGGQGGGGAAAESPADKLYRYLTGHFDSKNQAKTDLAFFPIDLLTCPIDIPEIGVRVLHVEQAVIDSGVVQAPYRQRVYVVTEGADPATQAVSQVWEFKSPAAFAGFCAGTGDKATPADLIERVGCQVELTWAADHFEGSTPGKECLSDFQGATYATSEVKIWDTKIESWDRGYDAMDKQVWGATKGPYLFDRISPLPPEQ